MKLEDIEGHRYFAPVEFPHRALSKLWAIGDGAIAVLTEDLKLLCLRADLEVIPLTVKQASDISNARR